MNHTVELWKRNGRWHVCFAGEQPIAVAINIAINRLNLIAFAASKPDFLGHFSVT